MYLLNVKAARHGLLVVLSAVPLFATAADDFVLAAKQRDANTIRELIQGKADVNSTLADGSTALAWAVHNNDNGMVKTLLEAGADTKLANEYGVSPLHLACSNQNVELVSVLLKAGADPDAATWSGETALMSCANSGVAQAVKEMLSSGANPNLKESRQDQTALMWAAAEDHPDVIKALIEGGADVNAKSRLIPASEPFIVKVPSSFGQNFPKTVRFRKESGGFTPLMFAAQKGGVETARLLIEAGADVNYATREEGSALVVATAAGHQDFALLLLDNGADPNAKDGWGIRPLHYAVHEGVLIMNGYARTNTDHLGWERRNMPELVEALLDAGADPEARVESSFSFLDHKFIRGNEDPPQIDIIGATPLLLAAASGDTASMRILVEKGQADKKARTDSGATLFMLAAGSGAEMGVRDEKKALEAAKLALAMGDVDVNAQLTNDDAVNGPGTGKIDGRTAAHFAAYLGWKDMIKFLAENGANLDVADRYGQTPLMIAMGDPEARYYRNIPVGRYDDRYRRPSNNPNKAMVETLLQAGAKPFAGTIIDKGSVN
jgi:ankyrin repeat protein